MLLNIARNGFHNLAAQKFKLQMIQDHQRAGVFSVSIWFPSLKLGDISEITEASEAIETSNLAKLVSKEAIVVIV